MKTIGFGRILRGWLPFLLAVLVAGPACGADFVQLQKAKEALQQRMQARYASGWKPKTRDEQLLTRLRASKLQWERAQDREAQKSAFLAARAEVYMTLAVRYASYASRSVVYDRVPTVDPYTGAVTRRTVRHEYRRADPFAAALTAWWGERAATAKGMAAAKEYRANTYYRKISQATAERIAELESQILVAARDH